MTDSTQSVTTWSARLPSCESLSARALELFAQGSDCEEAVVRAFNEFLELGLTTEPQPKRRGGLGAGTSVCGSLLGATSVIVASSDEDDLGTANRTLELMAGFREKYGSVSCQFLTRHMKWGDNHTFCVGYVRSAVEGLHQIMTERLAAGKPGV
ncbi:MAG: C-GCAxxG-C-C family protein [Deltaproteobacteria bacterium]|jgi:C_GCAxxG_C_C family probable redox protein|nr:C-GCAxxG-C-C family protein [Deltaproteobacteria bacterium]